MDFKFYTPTEEHGMLREMVQGFVQKSVEPQAEQHDRSETFNLDLFRQLGGDLGLLGITVPETYGGAGLDAVASVIVHEELSFSDPGFCLAYLAHAILCANNFYINSNESQRKELLPKMCSGEFVGAMGMSEPNAGTDVLAMSMTAQKTGDHYILNGQKMWITNGCIDDNGSPCDGVLVYARTGEGSDQRPEISTFMVLKEHEGFSVGQKIRGKLGMRGSNTAELVFKDCKVPAEWLIGKEGDSMTHMMKNLEVERLTLAAMALGIARRSLEVMVKYAGERHAFGQPINQFGQIQKFIGESFAEYRAARSYVYQTARFLEAPGRGGRADSDGVKLFVTTAAKNIADRAIQVLGGYGYVSEYVVERLWRDSKLLEIGGGTLEAHQKNISKDLAKNLRLIIEE